MKPRAVYRLSLAVVGVLSALNVGVVVWVVSRLRSPVSYNVRVIEPPSLPPAPVLLDPSLPGNPSTNSVAAALPVVLPDPVPAVERYFLPFQYFEVGGVPAAFVNGRYIYPNSRHAYGVVRDIYPERIYLEGGSYIDNAKIQRSIENDPISTGSSPSPK